MAWCPKCRNEYVEGITTCADCGVALVDELPEAVNPGDPVVLCHVDNMDVGSKFVVYLNYGNIQTAGLMATGETEEAGFDVVAAEFEREAAEEMLSAFGSVEELAKTDLSELVPDLEKQLEELQDEEANQMFSDLRTETSTVYVKKKDKYNDLKFSGISFIVFGILGCGLLALNFSGVLHIFNMFSSLIMALVFVVFLGVGIGSLIRAGKLKAIVSEEERVTNEALDWIERNITDEYIASLVKEELSEEDNYFQIHDALCEKLSNQFAYMNKGYIEQLMDDRYNQFCEESSRS